MDVFDHAIELPTSPGEHVPAIPDSTAAGWLRTRHHNGPLVVVDRNEIFVSRCTGSVPADTAACGIDAVLNYRDPSSFVRTTTTQLIDGLATTRSDIGLERYLLGLTGAEEPSTYRVGRSTLRPPATWGVVVTADTPVDTVIEALLAIASMPDLPDGPSTRLLLPLADGAWTHSQSINESPIHRLRKQIPLSIWINGVRSGPVETSTSTPSGLTVLALCPDRTRWGTIVQRLGSATSPAVHPRLEWSRFCRCELFLPEEDCPRRPEPP